MPDTSFDVSFAEQFLRDSAWALHCQKLQSLSYMLAADSVALSVFVLTCLFSKAMQKSSRHTDAKTV